MNVGKTRCRLNGHKYQVVHFSVTVHAPTQKTDRT